MVQSCPSLRYATDSVYCIRVRVRVGVRVGFRGKGGLGLDVLGCWKSWKKVREFYSGMSLAEILYTA